jgi:two-component system sensor histidine kinase KdpD
LQLAQGSEGAIDTSVGRWSMEHGQMAGHGTDTLAAAPRCMCR